MHLLVFEPRLEGHHLSWLRYVTEDLLSAGHRLTLAIDGRDQATQKYHDAIESLLGQVSTISIFNPDQRLKGGTRTAALCSCFAQSQAQQVFINNLDDIASSMLRRAAVGMYPPHLLKGKLSGVYFRPRFLANPLWPLGNIPKQIGFSRLIGQGWFHRICLVDEYLLQRNQRRYPHDRLTFLPDTWSGHFSMTNKEAREKLGIPTEKFVLLHYGIGTRRKGLHLVVRAMLSSKRPDRWHLLCAGQLSDDRQINHGIRRLTEEGCATVLNRYVSKDEEEACFAATDVVLLPYVRHFGSSGVLALSAAAGKMVVTSDEGLIARRVREKELGICFTSGDTRALKQALNSAEQILSVDSQRYAD
ncbi:MAG: glycosyltransferase, partial [Desulfobacteraceae bacterium]|nr:glycosyltransferase [Desulfobacteraceae bacterium]